MGISLRLIIEDYISLRNFLTMRSFIVLGFYLLQVVSGGLLLEDDIHPAGYGEPLLGGYGERVVAVQRPAVVHERPVAVRERLVTRPVVVRERVYEEPEIELGYGGRAAAPIAVRDEGLGVIAGGLGGGAVVLRGEGHGVRAAGLAGGAVLIGNEGARGAAGLAGGAVLVRDDLDDAVEGATFFERGHGYGHEYGEAGPYASSGRYVQFVGKPTRYLYRRIGYGRADAERRVAPGRRVARPVGDRKLLFLDSDRASAAGLSTIVEPGYY